MVPASPSCGAVQLVHDPADGFLEAPPAVAHSGMEARYAALGRTRADRRLSAVFTIRGTLIRVISARDMGRRDRRLYAAVEAAQ